MIATSPRDRLSAHLIQQSTPNYVPGSPHGRSRRATKQTDPGAFAWTVRHLSDRKITSKSNQSRGPLFRHLLSFQSNRAAKLFVVQIASCHTMESRCISLPEEEIANICVEVPHTQLFIHSQQDGISQGFWWGEGGEHTQSSHMRLGVALLSLLTQ